MVIEKKKGGGGDYVSFIKPKQVVMKIYHDFAHRSKRIEREEEKRKAETLSQSIASLR